MLNFSLFDNFRDNEGKHETPLFCGYCSKPSEVYICLSNNDYVCKTCLTKMINKIDEEIQKEIKLGKRR